MAENHIQVGVGPNATDVSMWLEYSNDSIRFHHQDYSSNQALRVALGEVNDAEPANNIADFDPLTRLRLNIFNELIVILDSRHGREIHFQGDVEIDNVDNTYIVTGEAYVVHDNIPEPINLDSIQIIFQQ
jgi:hypothetical protein